MGSPRVELVERDDAAASVSKVIQFGDGLIEGEAPPLVPDGDYLAQPIGHVCLKMREFGNAPKVLVRFKLHEPGLHFGVELFRAYRVRSIVDNQHFTLGRRSQLLREYCRLQDAPDHRPRLDRISLRSLKMMMVLVRTRTVSTVKREGRVWELPPALRYSVVAEILRRAA